MIWAFVYKQPLLDCTSAEAQQEQESLRQTLADLWREACQDPRMQQLFAALRPDFDFGAPSVPPGPGADASLSEEVRARSSCELPASCPNARPVPCAATASACKSGAVGARVASPMQKARHEAVPSDQHVFVSKHVPESMPVHLVVDSSSEDEAEKPGPEQGVRDGMRHVPAHAIPTTPPARSKSRVLDAESPALKKPKLEPREDRPSAPVRMSESAKLEAGTRAVNM